MAELDQNIWEDVLCGHPDRRVIITGDRHERVVHVLKLREVLYPCFEAFGGREEADGDIVGSVIDAVEEGNLLLVAPHSDVLPVHDDLTSEAFSIAVIMRNAVVMRKLVELCHELSVGRSNTNAFSTGKGADACSLQVQIEKRFSFFAAMINAEVPMTIITVVSIYAPSRSFSACA